MTTRESRLRESNGEDEVVKDKKVEDKNMENRKGQRTKVSGDKETDTWVEGVMTEEENEATSETRKEEATESGVPLPQELTGLM